MNFGKVKAHVYDLSKAAFPGVAVARRPRAEKVDVSINVAEMAYGMAGTKKICLSISMKYDLAEKLGSERVSAAVIEDRLYIKPMENGYKMTDPHGRKTRKYVRIPVSNFKEYVPFVGDHDLHYDKYNKAYYVER